jgi:hypothetical protein
MERKEKVARPQTRTAPQPAEPTIASLTRAIGQKFSTVATATTAKDSHSDATTDRRTEHAAASEVLETALEEQAPMPEETMAKAETCLAFLIKEQERRHWQKEQSLLSIVDREIVAAFGFVANPNLCEAQLPTWQYFERSTTMAFHDLTTRLKPPRNIRILLVLNLKLIPTPTRNTQWRKFEEEILPQFGQDLKVKVSMADQEEDPDYNPKMYIKSEWTPRSFQIPYEIQTRLNELKQALKKLVKPQKNAVNLLRHQKRSLNQLRKHTDFIIVQCDKNLGPGVIKRLEYIMMAFRDHLKCRGTYKRVTPFQTAFAKGQLLMAFQDWIKRNKNGITNNKTKYFKRHIATNTDPFGVLYLLMKVHKTPLSSRGII